MGFNRNIVECKAALIERPETAPSRFNRNIVECKVAKAYGSPGWEKVLIETLWNVKYLPGSR